MEQQDGLNLLTAQCRGLDMLIESVSDEMNIETANRDHSMRKRLDLCFELGPIKAVIVIRHQIMEVVAI